MRGFEADVSAEADVVDNLPEVVVPVQEHVVAVGRDPAASLPQTERRGEDDAGARVFGRVPDGRGVPRGWTGVTSRSGVEVGKTLMRLAQNRTGYGDAAAEVMDEYVKYLRQTTDLPRIYGLRFYSELERIRDDLILRRA